jgi:hypothetical protein
MAIVVKKSPANKRVLIHLMTTQNLQRVKSFIGLYSVDHFELA